MSTLECLVVGVAIFAVFSAWRRHRSSDNRSHPPISCLGISALGLTAQGFHSVAALLGKAKRSTPRSVRPAMAKKAWAA